MNILAIDTSCDETSVAVTCGRKVLSNVLYSQVLMHKKWGGVLPSLAKKAHEERIDMVVEKCLKKASLSMPEIDFIAVTYGPGLAIALEVGINTAQQLGQKYNKKIIPINHMAGHIYSCFVQNKQGIPQRPYQFPYLSLLISGGHTELILFQDHHSFKILGQTRDDAAGEAIDKIGRLMGLGYPAGPAMERLAKQVSNKDFHAFPRAMLRSHDMDFSFSGIKTAFLYYYRTLSEQEKNTKIKELASSFQEAVFESLLKKTEKAILETNVNRLVVGGGVIANMHLRNQLRKLLKKHNGTVLFPPLKYLAGDNASMIGVAAYYKALKKQVVSASSELHREPRLSLQSIDEK